jgi:hypothetical protein
LGGLILRQERRGDFPKRSVSQENPGRSNETDEEETALAKEEAELGTSNHISEPGADLVKEDWDC